MTVQTTTESPPIATRHAKDVRRPSTPRIALAAARTALQWRLMLWWVLLMLVPTSIATLPVWQLLGEQLDYSVHAARLAERLDLLAISDLLVGAREHAAGALNAGALVALVLTLLLSPLLSSMMVAAARSRERLGFLTLLAGGAQGYGRMLRMLVVAIVPLGIVAVLSGVAFNLAGKTAASTLLETDAQHAARAALGVTLLLVALAHATLDAGRAMLGNDRRRRSAWIAWWHGVKLTVRHPLVVLGTYFAVGAVGLGLGALLALARMHVPALGGLGTLGALVLAQLGVVAIGWTRCARLFALMALARERRP
jgi:hypothetical protein